MIAAPLWLEHLQQRVYNEDDAVAFVDRVGFCTWFPLKGLDFPNLAQAMARQYDSVWDLMEDTWFWKDDLHTTKKIYYAKIFARQPSFISLHFLPYFISARGPRDPFHLFETGRLSKEALDICEFLADNGPTRTKALRKGVRLASSGAKASFDRALLELQAYFIVCKVGISGRTRGTYGYIWDLLERWLPDAVGQAEQIARDEGMRFILERCRELGLTSSPEQTARIFGWELPALEAVASRP